jgi:hypothetical protein
MCSVCVCLDAVDSCVNIIGGMTVFASLEDAVVGVHYGEMKCYIYFLSLCNGDIPWVCAGMCVCVCVLFLYMHLFHA